MRTDTCMHVVVLVLSQDCFYTFCFALYFRTFRWHLCFNCVGQVSTASLPERVYGCWAVWLAHRSRTGRRQGGGGGLRTTTVAGRSHRTCHRGAPLPAQPLLLQICGCWGCWLLEVAFGDCWLCWLAVTGLLVVLTGSDWTAGCANWRWLDCWVCWLAVTGLLGVLTGGDRTAGCAGWWWLDCSWLFPEACLVGTRLVYFGLWSAPVLQNLGQLCRWALLSQLIAEQSCYGHAAAAAASSNGTVFHPSVSQRYFSTEL